MIGELMQRMIDGDCQNQRFQNQRFTPSLSARLQQSCATPGKDDTMTLRPLDDELLAMHETTST
jgi:hypothetical protein